MTPNVLSIAGSDPSGGAGIQADLKTFGALHCYGMAVITALTAQNTMGVTGVHVAPVDFVAAQIDAIFADIRVDAVKIGMLASGAMVEIVARRLAHHAVSIIVVDPVLVATSGDSLGAPDVVDALRRHLLPLATLVTPNLSEAARLADAELPANPQDVQRMAERLRGDGAPAILIKGGHMDGPSSDDYLYDEHGHQVFAAPRIGTRNTHGTGCTLSSAIACYLAHGLNLAEAIRAAKAYVSAALAAADSLDVGHGHGPLQHFFALEANAADTGRN